MIALLLAALAASPDPAPEAPAVVAAAPDPAEAFVGTAFRSDSLCFEVHPGGRVVLWDRDPHSPKIAIRGSDAKAVVTPEGITWTFLVEKIERSRWISPCRKEVVSEAELPSIEIGAVELKVGERAEVRLEQPDGETRLCVGVRCPLVRREPLGAEVE